MHYYTFNIADYRKDTMHLTPIEHYIYRELLDSYYLDESPIPNKTQMVLRLLRLGKEHEEQLNNVLSDFFEEKDGYFYHKRIEEEVNRYQARADKNRENGKKGGRPRKKEKTQSVTDSEPNRNPEESEKNPNQEPITKKKKNIKKRKFEKPSVDDVRAYCRQRENNIDAQQFIDHYEASGWVRGKTPIVDWKACVRTWERNDRDAKPDQPTSPTRPSLRPL